eukprot:1225225-Pleurochrysis_carterae.AAC.1
MRAALHECVRAEVRAWPCVCARSRRSHQLGASDDEVLADGVVVRRVVEEVERVLLRVIPPARERSLCGRFEQRARLRASTQLHACLCVRAC